MTCLKLQNSTKIQSVVLLIFLRSILSVEMEVGLSWNKSSLCSNKTWEILSYISFLQNFFRVLNKEQYRGNLWKPTTALTFSETFRSRTPVYTVKAKVKSEGREPGVVEVVTAQQSQVRGPHPIPRPITSSQPLPCSSFQPCSRGRQVGASKFPARGEFSRPAEQQHLTMFIENCCFFSVSLSHSLFPPPSFRDDLLSVLHWALEKYMEG